MDVKKEIDVFRDIGPLSRYQHVNYDHVSPSFRQHLNMQQRLLNMHALRLEEISEDNFKLQSAGLVPIPKLIKRMKDLKSKEVNFFIAHFDRFNDLNRIHGPLDQQYD